MEGVHSEEEFKRRTAVSGFPCYGCADVRLFSRQPRQALGCSGSRIKKGTGEPKMSKQVEIKWLSEPEEHDYPAALAYLSLLYDEQTAATHVDRLKRAPIAEFKAKDIFRASGLSLLGISNAHVEKSQQKIQSGHQLSPLLLIRDSVNGKVIVVDGYHRLCAIYSCDEDAVIPCKIA